MDDISITHAGFVVFLVLVGIGRILAERALRHLSADEKVRLIDGFSSLRAVLWVPSAALVVVAFAIQRRWPGHAPESLLFTVAGGIGLVIATYAAVIRRLRALSLPDAYVRRFLTARLLALAGSLILIATIVHPVLEVSR
ncbi:MAG: hypothetical protein IT372_03635 [Polyangiaceae bacterium]|nr:hypothetical protein [Polyangiaceae bacterium]